MESLVAPPCGARGWGGNRWLLEMMVVVVVMVNADTDVEMWVRRRASETGGHRGRGEYARRGMVKRKKEGTARGESEGVQLS